MELSIHMRLIQKKSFATSGADTNQEGYWWCDINISSSFIEISVSYKRTVSQSTTSKGVSAWNPCGSPHQCSMIRKLTVSSRVNAGGVTLCCSAIFSGSNKSVKSFDASCLDPLCFEFCFKLARLWLWSFQTASSLVVRWYKSLPIVTQGYIGRCCLGICM